MEKIESDQSKPSAHAKYRADIDGLRAIAVLAVVGFHAFPTSRWFSGGFIGVDIFFVISGFLISTILLNNFQRNSFSLTEFYRRRILRIFPALTFVLISCLLVGWITLFADEFKQIGKHAAAGVTFISNLVLWNESGYFDSSANTKPLQHLWSLGIEEQFYLIWPLILWVTYKRKINVLITITVIIAISFGWNIFVISGHPIEAFFSPLTRFWELLIGSLLAYITIRKSKNSNRNISPIASNLLSIFGIVILGIGFWLISDKKAFPGYWALFPTIGAALIIAAGSNAFINSKILSNRLLVWVGLISYPLYLWHWPILTFLRVYEGTFREMSTEKIVFAVVISIFLAWVTYRFVEQPIRFGKNGNKKSLVLLFLLSIVGMAGWQIHLQDGYAGRIKFEPEKAAVLFKKYPHEQRNNNCQNIYPELKDEWSCLLSQPKKAEVAIIGDSHAHMYYQGLASSLERKSVLNYSSPACAPFASQKHLGSKCKMQQKATLDFLTKHESIKTVYLTGYFSFLSAGGFKNGNIAGLREAQILDKEQEKTFIDNGTQFIQTLKDAKKDVVLIKDIPDAIFKPTKCVKFESEFLKYVRTDGKSAKISSPNECFIDRVNYENRNRPYEMALTKILDKFPTVRTFDPRTILCNKDRCWVIKNGVPLYWDSDHLTIEGSNMVIDSLIKLNPPLLSSVR
jgi:peptidoglycan/LPS O-acetylase OafA/YrhL